MRDRVLRSLSDRHGAHEELPLRASTAAHDLAVGLICFDKVYIPLTCVGRLVQLLTEVIVLRLYKTDLSGSCIGTVMTP
jgi:hypothetical protein